MKNLSQWWQRRKNNRHRKTSGLDPQTLADRRKILEREKNRIASFRSRQADEYLVDLEVFVQYNDRRGSKTGKSVLTALRDNQDPLVVLRGKPGYGKTTILLNYADELISAGLASPETATVTPIYLELKKLHRKADEKVDSHLIRNFVWQTLRGSDPAVAKQLERVFERGLASGAFLFLFDGFDEIPEIMQSTEADQTIDEYVLAIENFITGDSSQCQGIIASRPYHGPGRYSLPIIEIRELSADAQLKLIRNSGLSKGQQNLLNSLLPVDPERPKAAGSSTDLSSLITSPLFLSLLIDYVREHNTKPVGIHPIIVAFIDRRLAKKVVLPEETRPTILTGDQPQPAADSNQLVRSIVRIYKDDRQTVVGAGFLVGDKQVLTCAHVINDALRRENDVAEAPQAPVYLDFPLLAPNRLFIARVVLWQPHIPAGASTWEGDIAGLEIAEPPPIGAGPVQLIQQGDFWKHEFRAFGFPADHPNGSWTPGRILDQEATGWIQIEGEETGLFVAPGFSGTPIWDNYHHGVIGMVVARHDALGQDRVAYAISAARLLEAWPEAIQTAGNLLTRTKGELESAPRVFDKTELRQFVEQIGYCMSAYDIGVSPDIFSLENALVDEGFIDRTEFMDKLQALIAYRLGQVDDEKQQFSFPFPNFFQQYLAAQVLIKDPARIDPEVLLLDGRWREVLVLLFQDQKPPQKIQACLDLAEDCLVQYHVEIIAQVSKEIDLDAPEDEIEKELPVVIHWPRHAYHVIELLQDAFTNHLDDLPENIRLAIGNYIEWVSFYGSSLDCLNVLEIAGAAPESNKVSVLGIAFNRKIEIQEWTMFQLLGSMMNIPRRQDAWIKRWIRLKIVDFTYPFASERQVYSANSKLYNLKNNSKYVWVLPEVRNIFLVDGLMLILAFLVTTSNLPGFFTTLSLMPRLTVIGLLLSAYIMPIFFIKPYLSVVSPRSRDISPILFFAHPVLSRLFPSLFLIWVYPKEVPLFFVFVVYYIMIIPSSTFIMILKRWEQPSKILWPVLPFIYLLDVIKEAMQSLEMFFRRFQRREISIASILTSISTALFFVLVVIAIMIIYNKAKLQLLIIYSLLAWLFILGYLFSKYPEYRNKRHNRRLLETILVDRNQRDGGRFLRELTSFSNLQVCSWYVTSIRSNNLFLEDVTDVAKTLIVRLENYQKDDNIQTLTLMVNDTEWNINDWLERISSKEPSVFNDLVHELIRLAKS